MMFRFLFKAEVLKTKKIWDFSLFLHSFFYSKYLP